MQFYYNPDNQNNNNLFNIYDTNDIEYNGNNNINALINNTEINDCFDLLENINEKHSDIITGNKDWKLCLNCNISMEPMKFHYRCPECGMDSSIPKTIGGEYNESIINNHNTNNTSASKLKIVGKKCGRYQKAYYKHDSNYKNTQFKNTMKQLNRFNDNSKTIRFQQIILKQTTELYSIIQSNNIVKRGNSRKGLLAACLSRILCKNHITKKDTIIAKFFELDKTYISKGNKQLNELYNEKKIIFQKDKKEDLINDYITQYFMALNIDQKYKQFAIDIINASCSVKMRGENNSKISTKCAGVVYILGIQKDLDYAISDIQKHCNISKTTFMRYYMFILNNRKRLKHIFIEHNIPALKKKDKKKKDKKKKNE